jgi:hypothetical protein
MHFPFSSLFLLAQSLGRERLFGSRPEEIEENPADILDNVIGRPRLEGGDRDPPLVDSGHVNDRGRIRQRPNFGENLEAFLATGMK